MVVAIRMGIESCGDVVFAGIRRTLIENKDTQLKLAWSSWPMWLSS